MKVLVPKKIILDAILLAERLVGKKESLPVLSCIFIEAQKEVVLRSTNLEAGMEIHIPCTVEERGNVAVPANILSQTLRSISGDTVSLRSEEGNLFVESKGTKTLIKATPSEEFPMLPSEKGKGSKVSREKLLRGLQAVSYAASPSMIRPELGSVYVSLKVSGMTCVATDSFRLAEKKITGVSGEDAGDILIPLKHVNELCYILERIPSESVSLGVEDAQLSVVGDGALSGQARFVSRVVEANFPDYKTIIPK